MSPPYFRHHDPDLVITSVREFEFNPSATCPKFLEFLQFLTCGNLRIMLTLQLWLASILLSSIRHEKLLWLWGDGDNGKSVFAEVIRLVLGPSIVATLNMEQLSGKHEMAALANTRLNICNEFSSITSRQESVIKRLTSHEPIAIDEKFKPVYSATLELRLMFLSNSVPHVRDKTSGFWRRVVLVECLGVVPESRKVQGFANYLFQYEAAGIFNWILAGAVELTKRNGVIYIAPEIKRAVDGQRRTMDPHTEFLNEQLIETDHDKWLPGVKILYEAYVVWMRARGHKGALSWPHFKDRLEKVYPNATMTRRRHPVYGRQYGYSGIFWKDSIEQQEDYDQRVAEDLAKRHATEFANDVRKSVNEEFRRRRYQQDKDASEQGSQGNESRQDESLCKNGDESC